MDLAAAARGLDPALRFLALYGFRFGKPGRKARTGYVPEYAGVVSGKAAGCICELW